MQPTWAPPTRTSNPVQPTGLPRGPRSFLWLLDSSHSQLIAILFQSRPTVIGKLSQKAKWSPHRRITSIQYAIFKSERKRMAKSTNTIFMLDPSIFKCRSFVRQNAFFIKLSCLQNEGLDLDPFQALGYFCVTSFGASSLALIVRCSGHCSSTHRSAHLETCCLAIAVLSSDSSAQQWHHSD